VEVQFGAAYHANARFRDEEISRDPQIICYEKALRIRLHALGEQHPATAVTLMSMGTAYSRKADQQAAIMFYKRALRIYQDTLGMHPATAMVLSSLGAAYDKNGQNNEAIDLYKQALCIYERTVGEMHRDTAQVILNMSTAYAHLQDFVKAEELGQKAVKICRNILDKDHTLYKRAHEELEIIVMLKSIPLKILRQGMKGRTR
jgi:tetratricopeptide (TPR) repeat protein